MHDAEGKLLSSFTARAGETLTFDLVGDELVTPDGKHRIHKTHRYVCFMRGMYRMTFYGNRFCGVFMLKRTDVHLQHITQRHQRGDDRVQGVAGGEEEADGAHQRSLPGDGIELFELVEGWTQCTSRIRPQHIHTIYR